MERLENAKYNTLPLYSEWMPSRAGRNIKKDVKKRLV